MNHLTKTVKTSVRDFTQRLRTPSSYLSTITLEPYASRTSRHDEPVYGTHYAHYTIPTALRRGQGRPLSSILEEASIESTDRCGKRELDRKWFLSTRIPAGTTYIRGSANLDLHFSTLSRPLQDELRRSAYISGHIKRRAERTSHLHRKKETRAAHESGHYFCHRNIIISSASMW